MSKELNFCPMCCTKLGRNASDLHCFNCKWTHYNGPSAVVVILGLTAMTR